MKKVKKAIIPAAGLGTRFLPATKSQPKEMLPIVDKPTIQYIVEEAIASGIEDIIIVTGRNKRSIEDHFDKSIELELELERKGEIELLEIARSVSEIANVQYIRQKEPKGLGHAILMCKSMVGNEPFAVLLGDDLVVSKTPCLKQLIDIFEEQQATILGVQEVEKSQVSKYGIIECKDVSKVMSEVIDLVEKPCTQHAPSNIAILGRYIITPRIFEFLENQEAGAKNEIQLTDSLKRLSEVERIFSYKFTGKRYDVGNKQGFLEANIEFALRRKDLRDDLLEYLNRLMKDLDGTLSIDNNSII
ncbi:MAG: UTP--glucose-phosphate uridylyltransferase [Clostridiales bacterium]|jgi:UTP--glucose-1-phosphate uridylyltransferase|nr:UTP--glucose-phosphate uridylyltransferase [Clostridiales bacterium]